jgi:glutamate 5-kinase
MRNKLISARRIVLKVGTSLLTASDGSPRPARMRALAAAVAELSRQCEVLLVSSGAIAFGMKARGLKARPRRMARLQACAAVGQTRLMRAWEDALAKHRLLAAQVLLTRDGLERRARYLAASRTLEDLLQLKTLPIINENDTVATEEISFGDNDLLSVQVGQLVRADLVVLLSDVEGFFLEDGTRLRGVCGSAEFIGLQRHLRDRRKENTVGGMKAKLAAAKLSVAAGIPLLLADGRKPGVVAQALAGQDVGTLFSPSGTPRSARRRWIAYAAARRGTLRLDAGAVRALTRDRRSLLPSGLAGVGGRFEAGDVVELSSSSGVFGRGVARFSSRELERIKGLRTSEAAKKLGRKISGEVVHRDDLVLWD